MVKKVEKEIEIADHPIAQESLEMKILYLNGLGLMMNVDGEIHEREKSFLLGMIRAFELEGSILDEVIAFSKNPDQEVLIEILAGIREKEAVKQVFMIDVIILSEEDGNLAQEEKELINLYFEKLDFSKQDSDFIKNKMVDMVKKNGYSAMKQDGGNFVFVKGGTFQMGGNNKDDEKPIHSVTLDNFYIGKYVVTQKEWKEVMGNNPSHFKGDNLPVEQVSWNDIQVFLARLNSNTGKNYRLPTEAEWEYAAKGGTSTPLSNRTQSGVEGCRYAGSNNINVVAWYDSNSGDKTHVVGTKQSNELGIYDMSGNVWEWCSDWYDGNYYSKSPSKNPQGSESGSYRVSRGGSWHYGTSYCRTVDRLGFPPDYRYEYIGFRLVRTL